MPSTASLPSPSELMASIPSPPFQDLEIGPLQFRMYGLVIAIGALIAVAIARRRFAARGGDPEQITNLAIFAVPAGLIGARLYHVITDFGDKYSGGRWWPNAFYIWEGGLGIPGAVLLGAVVTIFAAKRMGVDWRQVGDAAAPALPVAQAIGRLGNWFNQELYGGPTDLPWGLEVDQPAPYAEGTTFHPTFLYEGLWNLALAGFIVVMGRRIVLKPGRWFAVYVMGYGLGRLWVESLRIDFATEVLGLRVNIWISLLAIAGGALWLFWRGNPIDHEATAELRAGGNPLAHAAATQPTGDDESDSGAPDTTGDDRGEDRAVSAATAGATSVTGGAAEVGADPIGETGPLHDGPVPEGAVGEHDAGDGVVGIDPEERA
jgi:prolipoprotein diacylglyceryl transferase